VIDRLTARCLSMATRFDKNILGDGQVDTYRELRGEHANITAALEHTLGDARTRAPVDDTLGPARRGAALAIGLHGYWQMSGLLSEGRDWLGKVLRLFAPLSPEHAWALGVSGRLATFQGDIAAALAEIRESIRLAGDVGEPLAQARGYLYLNLALILAGSHAEALAAGETARQALSACDDRVGLICLEAQLGHLHQLAGDAGLAIECCERGLAMLGPASGERLITSYLSLISGFALFKSPGRTEACAVTMRRAVAAMHEIGDLAGIACAVEVLGLLAARRQRFDDAAWLLGAADTLWRRTPGRTPGRLKAIAGLEETHHWIVEKARGTLGSRRYEAAYARGAGMPLDDVIERAVEASAVASATLTRREREIVGLVAGGLSSREIATRLFISRRTVDAHVEHIFGKLEISSRVQLAVWLQSAGGAAGGRS
jgi:non-specific serine/threonine protein kinase